MKIKSITPIEPGLYIDTFEEIDGEDRFGGRERVLGWAVVSVGGVDRIEPFFLDSNQQPIVYSQHLQRVEDKAGDKLQNHSYQLVNEKGNLIQ